MKYKVVAHKDCLPKVAGRYAGMFGDFVEKVKLRGADYIRLQFPDGWEPLYLVDEVRPEYPPELMNR